MHSACREHDAADVAPITPTAGAGAQTPSVNETGGTGGAAVSGTAGSSASVAGTTGATAGTRAGSTAGTGATVAGSTGSAAGDSGGVAGSAGDTAAVSGATAGAAAGGGGADGAPSGPPAVIPAPVPAPLIWGFGIGITDVPAAVEFYSEVMEMTIEKDAVKRDDSAETFLYGTQAKRGARIVLMKFDDMRNTRKITAKLVWQASNAAEINRAAAMYPD